MAKKIWEKILKALKSRTVWVIVLMFLINGISGIREFVPVSILPYLDAVLGLLGVYFRLNPKQ